MILVSLNSLSYRNVVASGRAQPRGLAPGQRSSKKTSQRLRAVGYTVSKFKLQTLQNKTIRIITNSDLRTPITPKYRNLKILKITELYTFEIAKLMHQHSKNSLPLAFQLFLLRFPTFMKNKPSEKQKATSIFPNSLHADVKGH